MEFVNPGWYEKFYLPQYGSTEFDEAIWADKTKSIRFIDGMLENNPSEIKQLAEFLILFWIRTEGIQGVFSCGPIKTHYFENLPNWLKGNFPEFMKSSNLNDGKIPQGLVVLTPKDFNLKSDILGNIKFVSSWAELSITAEPLSIWPQRMMRHFQNYDLISDIPFTKTFSEDLRKMLPIVSISISFRTEVWISRPYWVFMRKRSDRLASCIEKLEKSFRCSMDVRSTQIY